MDRARSVLRDEGPAAFQFLIDQCGFDGPDWSAPLVGGGDTLVFRRSGLVVQVQAWWWKGESGFDTTVAATNEAGATIAAGLEMVYEECGLGPSSAVPGGHSGAGRTTRKRIEQHAAALREVMPIVMGPDAMTVLSRANARR